jgi:hypothetical protein
MSASAFLREQVPGLEPEMIEYVESLAMDDAVELDERHALLSEYLESLELSSPETLASTVSGYLELVAEKNRLGSSDSQSTKADAVSVCLEVLRAPKVCTEPNPVEEDPELKKNILRIYDIDDGVDEGDDEIMGLGRNENKLRVLRDREEARLRAKKEHEELAAQKVAQKLKAQGETIKARTVARKR